MNSIQTGSTIISINLSSLMNMEIPVLEVEDQHNLATQYIRSLIRTTTLKKRLDESLETMNNVYDNYKEN